MFEDDAGDAVALCFVEGVQGEAPGGVEADPPVAVSDVPHGGVLEASNGAVLDDHLGCAWRGLEDLGDAVLVLLWDQRVGWRFEGWELRSDADLVGCGDHPVG